MPTSTKYQPRGSKDKLIKSVKEAKGSLEVLSDFIKAKEIEDDSSIIDIKIANPLKKIYELLQDIKKHQSTTLSLRFTIPLIALPVFLLVAFQFGRESYICSQDFTTKKGVIKLTTVEKPVNQDGLLSRIVTSFDIFNIKTPSTTYTYEELVLLDDQVGTIVQVVPNKSLELGKFRDQTVLVSGIYSACTNILTLNSDKNITIY